MATNSHGKLRPTLMWGMQSDEEDVLDSELVPSSLSPIVPILAAAKRVKKDNPRVAFLCCLHALEKAHELDPTSAGPGVHEFKTHMLHRLDLQKVKIECMLATDDAGEIQLYYQRYYEKNLRNREHTRKLEEIAQDFQTAAVLYEVLKATVPPWKLDAETERYAKDVDERKRQYEIYNILPLYAVGVKPAIMEFPEIKVAIHALHNVDNLPVPRVRSTPDFSSENSAMHMQGFKSNNDILDWLSSIFGFQEGNLANQREHLILLLANMDRRNKKTEHHSERQTTNFMQLDSTTTERLMDQIFDNYYSWCKYLRCKQDLRLLDRCDKQQLELIYIALYLLIWGEASNIRFMPECLCYIFHHMANEVYEVLNGNLYSSTSATYQPAARDKEHFLREVISPIYQVLREEVKRGNEVKGSYSRWRNYDDLNEYFWAEECLKLGWPMDTTVDFLKNSDGKPANKRKLKTNFVEIRTFWHLFRSFYRMWTFLILAFQAMVIVAWRPSQSIAALFDEDVFRHVLSIFITSAFLNLLKATLDVFLICTAWRSLKLSQKVRHVLKLGVAAMHEDMFTLLKYKLFWILLIICKLAFSYHFEVNIPYHCLI